MSDRTNLLAEMGDDLELITSYLNGRLDPARVEHVRKRLDDDPAFRDLAAPMLLTWSVPTHLERHPRPAGELERHWDEFTRRAGFAHQRRKARRRRLWVLAIALLAVGLGVFLQGASIRRWYATMRDYATVPHDTGWIPLGDSIHVQFAKGTRLRAARQTEDDILKVLLDGSARFRVLTLDSASPVPRFKGIAVETRAGVAFGGESEFTVTTHGDTTDVEVHRPSRRRFAWFVPLPTAVLVGRDGRSDPIMLKELERARLVRGARPQRIAP